MTLKVAAQRNLGDKPAAEFIFKHSFRILAIGLA